MVDVTIARAISQFATIGLLAITLISFAGRFRVLELLTHFRLQYSVGAATVLIAAAILHSPLFASLALIAAAVNLRYVVPYYFKPSGTEQYRSVALKLMLANVLYVSSRYRKLLDQVGAHEPDVVVLQEFTAEWLAGTETLNASYPYSFVRERSKGAGMAIFSRYPMSETEAIRFDATERAGVFTRLDVEGTSLSLLTIHPSTPMTGQLFAQRNNQLAQAATRLRATNEPKVLLGDLNTSIFSPYLHDLLRGGGMRDARRGFGLLGSWPNPLPAFARIPIDHCLVSNEVGVERIRTGRGIGSDHLPLVVELRVAVKQKNDLGTAA